MREHQIRFLDLTKSKYGNGLSFVTELAELLKLSADSVYRRMRGETDLSYEEALMVSNRFGVPLQATSAQAPSSSLVFEHKPISSVEGFVEYLLEIKEELDLVKKHRGQVVYQATELPFFYNFGLEHLLAFKFFAWNKYIHNVDAFDIDKIVQTESFQYVRELCAKIYRLYQQVDTVEIWTEDTLDSTLKQLVYYKELGVFQDEGAFLSICIELKDLLMMLHRQTLEKTKELGAGYALYMSELSLDNTCILTKYEGHARAYLRHLNMNAIITEDAAFVGSLVQDLDATLQKSLLLSGTSEKQRNQFFRKLTQSVDDLM